jgi:hypothetical protein
MADGTGASALFPNLPSSAPSAAPAADRSAQPHASSASSVYGSPEGGLAVARATMATGVASPAAGQSSAPAPPAGEDWLKTLADRGDQGDRGDRVDDHADADNYLDLRALKLDPSMPVAGEFSTVAREIGIDQAAAGTLAALHDKALAATSTKYWSDQAEIWEKQSRSQFGPRLDAMTNDIKPLLNDRTLTTPAFRELLQTYKLGNHPAVIDTLSRWSAAIRNGRGRGR